MHKRSFLRLKTRIVILHLMIVLRKTHEIIDNEVLKNEIFQIFNLNKKELILANTEE
jgi:hypothetical protein